MKKEIGNKIKQVRKMQNNGKGMSMEKFGEMFTPPASKGVVSNWENNYNYPNEKRLKKIAELGNMTVDELLYGSLDDYARRLLNELEEELKEELKEDSSIKKGAVPLIVSDVENRLFPQYFPHGYKDRESLDQFFIEIKKDAIETWTNYDSLDAEIVTRIGRQISYGINNNLKYFYSDFYDNDDNSVHSGDKISERSNEFIKRLHKFDNLNRAYIDSLRFLENEDMVNELDKIDDYTDNLNKLNGSINLNDLDDSI